MKVKLKNIVSEMPQGQSPAMGVLKSLAVLPMAPRIKYRLGRIITEAEREIKEFGRVLFQATRDMCEPVEWVQRDVVERAENPPGMELKIVTDPAKLAHPENLQYRVKEENSAAFNALMEELAAQEVEFKFGQINVNDLVNAKGEPVDIAFDLSPIMWLLTDEQAETAEQ